MLTIYREVTARIHSQSGGGKYEGFVNLGKPTVAQQFEFAVDNGVLSLTHVALIPPYPPSDFPS